MRVRSPLGGTGRRRHLMQLLAHDRKGPGNGLVLCCRNGQHDRLIAGVFGDDDQGGGPPALDVVLDPAEGVERDIKLETVGPDGNSDTPIGDEESGAIVSLCLGVDLLSGLEQSVRNGSRRDLLSFSHGSRDLHVNRRYHQVAPSDASDASNPRHCLIDLPYK